MGKKESLIRKLADELENGFSVDSRLIPELIQLIDKSGQQDRFLAMLAARLKFLKEYRWQAQNYSNDFEHVNEKMYTIHLQSRHFNIRIFYSFLKDGTILLHAFYEREGKGRTDYSGNMPEAYRRLHDWEESL